MQLRKVGSEIWVYEGSEVDFYGYPFPTRMTVVRLTDRNLWIHSPEKINDELKDEISELGTVKYLISPNKLHHLFLPEWVVAYPEAITYSAPGLSQKRKDIKFDIELLDDAEGEWEKDINQTIFHGSPVMEEVVFYHKLSKTLVLTDLIENFNPSTLNWWQKGLAYFAGILSPNGKMPLDWRVSFLFGSKEIARKSLNVIMSWDTENVILSHGECVFGSGNDFIKKSFSWLNKNA